MLLDGFPQLLPPAMQMRPHRSDRQSQDVRNLLVRALLLMIEDENGALNRTQPLELRFDRVLELALLQLLLGVSPGMLEPVFPARNFVGERDMRANIPTPPLPLVLRYVHRNAIKIGGDQGFAAKARQRTIEAKKDILGEIIDMLAAPGQPQQGAKHHVLVLAHQLLEAEIGGQARLDHRVRPKFHTGQ